MLKFCKMCSKEFSTKPSANARFCSRACGNRWRAPLRRAKAKEAVINELVALLAPEKESA